MADIETDFTNTPALEDPGGDGAKTVFNLRYPGQYYDAFSGLHYNHTRYFSPRTGRYLQPDLIGLEGGTNVYTYANGNPVSYTDPTGTWAEASLTRQIGGYLDSALSWFGRSPFPSYYGQSSSLAQDVFQLPGVQIALLPAMITPVGLQEAAAFGAVRGAEELITLTKARFGHTFTRHGQGATDFLFKRAAGSGKPMGQFLDDQAAARLIQDNIGSLKNGAISVPVPQGFPARIIMPDGSISAPSSVRIVPSGNGVKTAYPEL